MNSPIKIGKVLKKYRQELDITLEKLADNLNEIYPDEKFTKGKISKWERDVETPKVTSLKRLADFYNTTVDEILVQSGIESKGNKEETEIPINDFEYKLFPCSIAAGALELVEGVTDYKLVTISDTIMGKYARKKDIILLKVNGDSMNKVIPNGSLIAVDTSKKNTNHVSDGDIVVFSNFGEYSVKRFFDDKENQRFLFKPDSYNELFTTIEIRYELALDVRLIGKVVKYIVNLD